MSGNFKSYIQILENTNNPIAQMYKTRIDTDKDGKVSNEEMITFEAENSQLCASIFETISKEEKSKDSGDNNSIFDTDDISLNPEDSSKNIFFDVSELEGINIDSFKELGNLEYEDENKRNFWESLSEFDLSKLFDFINTDKDEVLSKEELNKFATLDGLEDNLSLYDLNEFIEKDTEEIGQVPEENEETEEVEESKEKKDKNHISGGNGGSGNYIEYTGNTESANDKKAEYTDKLNEAKTVYNTAKSNYENFLDGNINDADVKDKKEAMENAYDLWQEELKKEDPELARNIDKAKSDVEEVNKKIAQNEKDIFNNEMNLSDCKTAYDSAQSYREGLENKKSELESSLSGLDSSNEADAGKIEYYQSQINAIESEIQTAKAKEEEAKTAKEKAQTALDESNQQKTDLEKELKGKEDILAGYVEESSKSGENNPTLNSLQNDYEDKKSVYETALSEYQEKLRTEAVNKHNEVNESQKELSEYENNEKIGTFSDILEEYDTEFAELLNGYLLAGASDSSKSDCGGAVRRAMYNAVKAKYGEAAASVFKEGYGVVGADWDTQYLADCPFYEDITSLYSPSELESMIQSGKLKGAVINYDAPKGQSGHVEGVTTKGLTSDYTRPHSYFRSGSSLGRANYHIYIPKQASTQEINDYIQLMRQRMNTYDSPIL